MSEVREGYKMTEIGEIPSDWVVEKLGNFVTVKARIGWRGLKATEYTESGPFLIAGKHIKGAKILWEECDHLSMDRYDESPEIQLRDKDVIISKDGTIGRVAFIDKLPGLATINGTMMLLRVNNPAIEPNFLYFYLQGHYFQRIIKEKVSGSSIPHLFQRDMDSLKIPIFNVEEQKKIAETLSTIDKQIDETEQLIVKTKELKKGLMQQLLTKGIGHTEFKHTELGEIPLEWKIISIKDIFDLISGYAFKSKLFKSEAEHNTLQVIKMGNIKQGELDLLKNKSFILKTDILESQNKYKLINGDIVLSLTGTVGKRDYGNVALIEKNDELVVNQRVGCLRKSTEKIDSKYYYYTLQTEVFRMNFFELGVGGTGNQSNVSLSDMGEIKVPYPPLTEQQKIASILSTVDEQIVAYEEEKVKYEELKKGLMQQLLKGRIRVKI